MEESRFTEVDHGYDDLLRQVKELEAGADFYIGLFSSDQDQVIKGGVHEFGAPGRKIPPRHWLSKFFDTHAKELNDIYVEATTTWLNEGGDSTEIFAAASGEVLVLLRGFLETNPLTPDLKDKTWERKDSDTMMIETSAMINAIAVRYNPKNVSFRGKSIKGKVRKLITDFRLWLR
jgi:hypothetical protein